MIAALYSPQRNKESISPEKTTAHKGSFDKAVCVCGVYVCVCVFKEREGRGGGGGGH